MWVTPQSVRASLVDFNRLKSGLLLKHLVESADEGERRGVVDAAFNDATALRASAQFSAAGLDVVQDPGPDLEVDFNRLKFRVFRSRMIC